MTALQTTAHPNSAFAVPGASKATRHRLAGFITWLDTTGVHWSRADLALYRDYLLRERGLAPVSAANHLASVRGRYRALLASNWLRDQLFALTDADLPFSDRKSMVDEALVRLHNNTNPRHAAVTVVAKQDHADAERRRLTPAQAHELLDGPERAHRAGLGHPDAASDECPLCLRDQSLIALLLCTGLREQELCSLAVEDLRQRLNGRLALMVRRGKGAKQRLIPYGELDWCLAYVDAWLRTAGITSGPVLRGFYRGFRRVRPAAVDATTVLRVVRAYPVTVDGEQVSVTPHDLRRTYARRCWEHGLTLEAIQQNLGHEELRTTLAYIGSLHADARAPGDVYRPRRQR